MTAEPTVPQSTDIPPLELAPEPPRLLPRWLWGLAGIGLFLAGAILGAVLTVAVTLYQLPAAPAATLPPAATPSPPPAPTATLPVPPTVAPTTRPLPTPTPIGALIGQQSPDFTLPGLDGLTYTLSAYPTQTVILNFWASWCQPCRQEWPEIWALAESLTTTQVVLLSVNVQERPEIVWRLVGTATLPFPILLDQDGQVSARYNVTVLPTTLLIEPAGRISHVLPGPLDAATLRHLARP